MAYYKITKDGKTKATAKTHNKAFAKLHKLQPFSNDHAMKHEGWDIKKVGN